MEHELAGVTISSRGSRVSCVRRVRFAEILAAMFPGGSVTGARGLALDQIARLEPVGRGASMGDIGVIQANGDFDLGAHDPHLRDRRGPHHLWVGAASSELGPGGRDRGVVVRARPLLAAVGGPVPDDAPGRRGRRSRPRRRGTSPCSRRMTRRCCVAAQRSRRRRLIDGRPFLLDRHLERLAYSAAALALPAPDGARELDELVVEDGAAQTMFSASTEPSERWWRPLRLCLPTWTSSARGADARDRLCRIDAVPGRRQVDELRRGVPAAARLEPTTCCS